MRSLFVIRCFSTAGQVFRQHAKEKGLTPAQLSAVAQQDPSIDGWIDFKTCELIASGHPDRLYILEGRQPAVMARYIREKFDKKNITAIYLKCSPREQALRLVEREVSPAALARLHEVLASTTEHESSFADIIATLQRYQDSIPDAKKALEVLTDNQNRDLLDRKRYQALYGTASELDNQNMSLYDIVVDTTRNQPIDTRRQALEALTKFQQQRVSKM